LSRGAETGTAMQTHNFRPYEEKRKPEPDRLPVRSARPAKPAVPDLLMRLLGKRIVVRLTFGDSVSGSLHAFSRYELVVIEGNGSQTIVFKGAVASVTEAVSS
jgi:sRNA-binding regulator protein Hfq